MTVMTALTIYLALGVVLWAGAQAMVDGELRERTREPVFAVAIVLVWPWLLRSFLQTLGDLFRRKFFMYQWHLNVEKAKREILRDGFVSKETVDRFSELYDEAKLRAQADD